MRSVKRFFIFLFCTIAVTAEINAQERKRPVTFSIFNNGTSLPGAGFLGVFSKTIHPGFSIGTYHIYHAGEKHELFQTFKFGFFYHRFVQYGIQLYSEAGYRYLFKCGWYAEGMLGAGYIHSIPDVQIFILKDGKYVKKKNFGKPEMMIPVSLAVGYDLEKKCNTPLRIFLQYQLWMQTPFVNKYVPLLPNTALHLGVRYLFNRKNKE
jgi:hypothetical protein